MKICYDFTEIVSKSVCVGSKQEKGAPVAMLCMIYNEAAQPDSCPQWFDLNIDEAAQQCLAL